MAFGEALKYMAISFGATFYPEIKQKPETRTGANPPYLAAVSLVLSPSYTSVFPQAR